MNNLFKVTEEQITCNTCKQYFNCVERNNGDENIKDCVTCKSYEPNPLVIDLESKLTECEETIKGLREQIKAYSEFAFNMGQSMATTEIKVAKNILDEVSRHVGGRWLVDLYKRFGIEE